MMLISYPLDLDNLLVLVESTGRYGARDRAIFYLRTLMRLKDIASLRAIDQVIDIYGDIRKTIVVADDRKIDLPPRARSELQRYLFSRFSIELRLIDRELGLFPTERNPYGATMKTLPQLFWAIDVRIRQYIAIHSKDTKAITGDLCVNAMSKDWQPTLAPSAIQPVDQRVDQNKPPVHPFEQDDDTLVTKNRIGYLQSLRRVFATVFQNTGNDVVHQRV